MRIRVSDNVYSTSVSDYVIKTETIIRPCTCITIKPLALGSHI